MGNPINILIYLIIIELAVAVRGIMKNYYKIKDGEEAERNIWGKIANKFWGK